MKNILKKPSERQKIQEIIEKIENDTFSASDIDLLLIKFREYSDLDSLFQEISHFAAHNQIRNKGGAFNHFSGYFSSIIYHTKYTFTDSQKLDFSKPIPKFVIETIKFNIKLSKDTFEEKYECSIKSFESMFNNFFRKIKGSNKYQLTGKPTSIVRKVTGDMLNIVISRPLFTQEKILQEIIKVIESNEFVIDTEKFKSNSEKIIVFIMFLMHGTEYPISDKITGMSYINILNENGVKKLSLSINIPVKNKDNEFIYVFPLFSTNINYLDHCSEKIIQSEINENNRDKLIIKNRMLDFSLD